MAAEANHPRTARPEPEEENPLEAPEADIAEQRTVADDDAPTGDWTSRLSLDTDPEVPEADAAEQAIEVPEDEDDYR